MTTGRPILCRRGGFSLVELILVIAIVGLLAAVAVPWYTGTLSNYRVHAAARRLVSDLTLARATARQRSQPVTVAFDPAAEQYRLLGVTDPVSGSGTPYVIEVTAEPYSAEIDALQLTAGATEITFDGFGAPSAWGTVTLVAGDRRRVVEIDASSGRASLQ